MARKNANGEGSRPRKRADGRWEARYPSSEGKRRSVYGKTRKEVADKLAEALSSKDDTPVFVPTDMTVAEFLAQYEDVARNTMKRRSFETYQSIAKVAGRRIYRAPSFTPSSGRVSSGRRYSRLH